MKKIIFKVITIITLMYSCNHSQEMNLSISSGLYLGLEPPGNSPEVFAKDIISIEDGKEYKPTISPDSSTIVFIRRTPGKRNDGLFISQVIDGKLIIPQRVEFRYACFEGQPCFSPDGNILYYMSCRPLPGESSIKRLPHLWYVERNERGWSKPKYLSCPIDEHHPAQISFSLDGAAYFVSNTKRKIYYSNFENGKFGDAILLNSEINGLIPIGHPTIAPDKSHIIVDRVFRKNNELHSDLYISYNNWDGTWTKPRSIKKDLNLEETGIYAAPRLTYDGKYLFLEKYDPSADKSDLYWVSTKIIRNKGNISVPN